jgi:hypothetical protein
MVKLAAERQAEARLTKGDEPYVLTLPLFFIHTHLCLFNSLKLLLYLLNRLSVSSGKGKERKERKERKACSVFLADGTLCREQRAESREQR